MSCFACGAAFFSAQQSIFGAFFRQANQKGAYFLHVFHVMIQCSAALSSGVYAEATAEVVAVDTISKTASPLQNSFKTQLRAQIVSWDSRLPAIDAEATAGDDAQPMQVELRGL